MAFRPLRWFASNLSTLILALILALVVWVSAVANDDPNEQATTRAIPLEVIGPDSSLMVTNELPGQARLTLRAPRSVWIQLNNRPELIEAWIDLSGLEAGTHTVEVKWQIREVRAYRFRSIEPARVEVVLEPLISEEMPVQVQLQGEPPIGYRRGNLLLSPQAVTVSGPESIVSQVEEVRGSLNIANARETVRSTLPVVAVNANGEPVQGVTVSPSSILATQPITLERGFKANVVVRVVLEGQPASGYRLTNVDVTPRTVTVYSDNPQLLNDLPAFVETVPVDVSGISDDMDVAVPLSLPDGISLAGEQSVLVQVSVAAIEGSTRITLPIEPLGLPPNLAAQVSPASIDVIVTGPLPVLDGLTPASFRAVVDLTGLAPGTYPMAPVVDLQPDQVRIETVMPETIEVDIIDAPTATVTLPASPTLPPTTPSPPAPAATP